MDIWHVIILDILNKMNGSRRCTGIYYILTGKKTSQSLSDSQWFGIEHYYASFKGMAYSAFNDALNELKHARMIVKKEDQLYLVTKTGEQFLLDQRKRLSFLENLNGLKYSSIESTCWHVITLFVQALSNALYLQSDYSPVVREREAVRLVKTLFPRSEEERRKKADALYREMHFLLQHSDSASAGIFIKKLSGYKRIGNTFEQIGREWNMSQAEAILRFRSVLHSFIQHSAALKSDFPVLHSLIGSFTEIPALTRSASLTYDMLSKDMSLQQIMKIRNLKASTLEDHLVEIAREIPEFSISPFISKKESDEIKRYYHKTKENKLRPMKDAFPHLSYLQIRLVLAKEGGTHGAGSST